MNQSLQQLSNEFMYNFSPKLTHQELAISLCNFCLNNVMYINDCAKHSLKVKADCNEALAFIASYKEDKSNFLSFIQQRLQDITQPLYDILEEILSQELHYLYKNLQLVYSHVFNISCDFIATSSCCDVCKFLVKKDINLTQHFQNDSCDSYLQLRTPTSQTINVFSKTFKIKGVPVKYRRNVESFLRLLLLRYERLIKPQYELQYFLAPQELELPDNTLMIKKDKTYQLFDMFTYKEDLLRHLLIVEESEYTRKLFYQHTSDKKFLPSCHFINFLAEQTSFNYLRESLIAWILHPLVLQEIDPLIYQHIQDKYSI